MSLRYTLLSIAFLAIGNQLAHSQVQDKIICPAHIYTTSDEGKCGSNAQFTCPFENVELENVQNNYSTDSWFETGSTSVYYKGMDYENNTHFCVFKVYVLDKELPAVSADFTEVMAFTTHKKTEAKVNWKLPQVTDNCKTVNSISTHESGESFPLGETPVTYWFYDSSGNCTEFTFTVVVKSGEPTLAEQE